MKTSPIRIYYPLRPIQQLMLDTNFNKAASTMMNISTLIKLSSTIDLNDVADTYSEFLQRHDVFRCRFEVHPLTHEFCQTFDSPIDFPKVEKISDEEFDERVKNLKQPYKIFNVPLYRIFLFQTPTRKFVYMDFYHGIIDGVSIAIVLANEMNMIYRGRKLKYQPASYAKYVLEESQISEERLEEGHAYWRKILAGFDATKHLPAVDVKGVDSWAKGDYDDEIKSISEEFFRNTRRDETTFFLAASMLTLAKITGSKTSIMSLIHNGRTTPADYHIMGLMMDQLPCAWDFTKDLTAEDFLNGLEGQIRTNMNYRKSLDVVYREGLESDCATLIFQKRIRRNHFMFGDTTANLIQMPEDKTSAAENSLDVEIWLNDGGTYDLFLDFDASRFSEQTMKNFAATLNKVIAAMKNEKILLSQILDGK